MFRLNEVWVQQRKGLLKDPTTFFSMGDRLSRFSDLDLINFTKVGRLSVIRNIG